MSQHCPTALANAEHEAAYQRGDYQHYARIEGRLTPGERAAKEKAYTRMLAAERRVRKLQKALASTGLRP